MKFYYYQFSLVYRVCLIALLVINIDLNAENKTVNFTVAFQSFYWKFVIESERSFTKTNILMIDGRRNTRWQHVILRDVSVF